MMASVDWLASHNVYIYIFTLLLLFVIYWYMKAAINLPPGPIGLPVFGYLPFIRKPVHATFARLATKYGPIFHMYLGGQLVIVLNDYESIKEAFVKQADVFSGRILDGNFYKSNEDRTGIVNVDGESWRQHRRFIVSNLRDNGVGKLSLEPLILNEIHCFMNELKKTCGEPRAMRDILSSSLLNNIHLLVTGNRYDYSDSTLQKTVGLMHTMRNNGDPLSLRTFLPWLTTLQPTPKHQIRWKCTSDLIDITKEIISEDRCTQSNLQYENFADAYMDEMKIQNNKEDKQSYFSTNGLLHTCRDLLVAGTDTSATTLLWGMIYLTNNPQVQTKVQEEIDKVIGRERDPSYNDRSNTPYTMATINEINRMATLVPLAIHHRTTQDTKLMGYHIPKDTTIIPNVWAVHNDSKLWGDPRNFRPERFLSFDGHLVTPEYLIPFSIGKRACAGEPLARMELYLYFTSFMQNFNLLSLDGTKLSLDSTANLTRFPLFDHICIERR